MPKVSIIVPVYDKGLYVAECLASIERQTLRDIEVLCIDDASTDDSLAICREFAAQDGRFKVIGLAKNQGVSAARNRGIREATGDFLMFMDADDWYPSDGTVELLYHAAVDHGASIAGGMMSEYDVAKSALIDDYRDAGHLALYHFEKAGMVDYRDWQGDFGFTRFIYERSLIVDSGLEFPPLIRHEDPPFFVKAMLAAGSFYAVPEVVYRYRIGYRPINLGPRALDDAVKAHVELLAIAVNNDLDILQDYVLESLTWYLTTQTPQGQMLRRENDRLRQEVEDLRSSKSYRLGNFVVDPLSKVASRLGRRRPSAR